MPRSRLSRRKFLTASGTALAGLPAAAAGPGPQPAGLIDCQSHLFVPEVLAFMKKRKEPPRIYSKDGKRFLVVGNWHRPMVDGIDLKAKLAAKDAAGIQLTALSTNDPGPEQFGADGPAVARMVHDYLADVVKQHATRFFALATLPLQDRRAAEAELDR